MVLGFSRGFKPIGEPNPSVGGPIHYVKGPSVVIGNSFFTFADTEVKGNLQTSSLGSFRRTLDEIKTNYLSKSKKQTIDGLFTFSKKLVVDNDLSCPKIDVVNGNNIEGLITYDKDGDVKTINNFKDRYSKVNNIFISMNICTLRLLYIC